MLLSRSSLEALISLDLVDTKFYCFRDRVHCYYCLYIIFSTNPLKSFVAASGMKCVLLITYTNYTDMANKISLYLCSYTVCYREIHHFCVLLGYGSDAICPYLVFETVANQRDQGR